MAHHLPDTRAEKRIEQLISEMSWEEKLAQLQIGYRPRVEDALTLVRGGIGAIFWPRGAAASNAMQRAAVEETRHGIPLLIGLDVIHGQHTIFPIPLAQAASFDPAVPETDGRLSAREAASGGVNWTFAPMLDVSRDPRWGRVAEGFGEDTYLTSVLGAAKVRGLQGTSLADPDSILACGKHYVAYGAAEGGRDYNTVDVSQQVLHDVYLPPFLAAVEAGCATVMASFNTVAGRPVHAHRGLLTDVLKREWGHEGFVVGDADGVRNLVAHGVAVDLHDALRQALSAGLDMEMGANVVHADGTTTLTPDDVPVGRVDDAVRRILQLKAALGLFENPYVEESRELTGSTLQARAEARVAAERSIVLLKNDGTLPLADGPLRVLLVGPYAESTDHLGAWVQSHATKAGSIADALRAERPDLDLTVLAEASFFPGAEPVDLREVARLATAADVVLVAVGEPSDLTGEAASRSDLRLPGDQESLIAAVAATGRPFAVVLVNGRPLVTSAWIDDAPAVLEAWHLGTEAAAAIAGVLTGAVNPAGRLPMSFPRSSGQVPVHYDHLNTGRPATTGGSLEQEEYDVGLLGPDNVDDRYTSKYRDLPLGPQFAFGHGLSYTTFEYRDLAVSTGQLSLDELRAGGRFEVSVEVTNSGDRSGDEVTQLFVRDPVASLARPVRRLRGFARTHLERGATATVTLSLGWADLGFATDEGAEFVVEPGQFTLHIGGGLGHTQSVTVCVV